MTIFDTAVIGGGLHGLSVALHLGRKGQRVVVLEREWCGRHASGASSAGVRTLGRDAADLPLALVSLDMWHDIASIVGDDCGFKAGGYIRAVENQIDLATTARRIDDLHASGYDNERMIDQQELRDLLPAAAPHLLGGAYAPRDGAADPHRTLIAFRRAAIAAGVELRERCGVVSLHRRAGGEWEIGTTTGERVVVGCVVNATGAWGARIAALVGEEIPLTAEAAMEIVTERVEAFVKPVVAIHGRNFSFKQTDQGGLMIGGGLQGRYDLDSGNTTLDFRALAGSARVARDILPGIGPIRILRCWTGIEAMTPDRFPIIGPSAIANGIWHVFGFSGRGFQMVPAVGAAVAEMVVSGRVPTSLALFGPHRFI